MDIANGALKDVTQLKYIASAITEKDFLVSQICLLAWCLTMQTF
jgi:hypothetical protein